MEYKILADDGHYLEEHLKMTEYNKVFIEDYKPTKEEDNG